MARTTQRTGSVYKAQDFSRLLGTPGFSEGLLATHFELYEGYVEQTNECLRILKDGVDGYPEGEVQRRLGWEFNGMRLHELYFGGMANGGVELDADGAFMTAIRSQFGSDQGFWKRFASIAKVRGIGWAVLAFDPMAERFVASWVDEHDTGILATTAPILVMDLFEHAYIRDYGTDRESYVEAYRNAIDWTVCEERWRTSRHQARTPGQRPARD